MRLNRYIAQYSGLSRRKADTLIEQKRVVVNREVANLGTQVGDSDSVIIDGIKLLPVKREIKIVLLNKPIGYVCSQDGQGAPTVYDLLQSNMKGLKIAGRLDKDSSGLVILTNDGQLLNQLTHPSNDNEKVYQVTLSKPLEDGAIAKFAKGVDIGDERVSKLEVLPLKNLTYEVRIHEGRNRQIRRSFEAMGYNVIALHRTDLGPYSIDGLTPKQFKEIE
jgi:pseudouridine synthase